MIAVTDLARKELKKMLKANSEDPNLALRLMAQEGELGFVLDTEMPGDMIIEYEGSKVLLCEEGLASHLSNISIDLEDTAEGPILTLRQAGCGGSCCGGGHGFEKESGCGGNSCCSGDC